MDSRVCKPPFPSWTTNTARPPTPSETSGKFLTGSEPHLCRSCREAELNNRCAVKESNPREASWDSHETLVYVPSHRDLYNPPMAPPRRPAIIFPR